MNFSSISQVDLLTTYEYSSDVGLMLTDTRICQCVILCHNYFVEQSTVDDDNMILPDIPILNYPQIDDILINENGAYKLLCNLDVNKATGNDQIGNKLLKESAPSISKILSKIFNTSIQNGKYPQVWKNACVIPIFKKGSHSNINNYRPVSLLPCVSKIFEKLVFNHILNYLRLHSVITAKQSGFINRRLLREPTSTHFS